MIPTDFAKDWEDGWNSHDLDHILSHYSEDVVFRSRKAIAISGSGEVRGKANLRTYWQAALDAQPDLHFTVSRVYVGHDILVIAYTNHNGINAAETLRFGADGFVCDASAAHSTS